MSLSSRFVELVSACAAFFIRSDERADALAEVAETCKGKGWKFGVWDLSNGLLVVDGKRQSKMCPGDDPLAPLTTTFPERQGDQQPISPLQPSQDSASALILKNFGKHLNGSPGLVQLLENCLQRAKAMRVSIVMLQPSADLPIEIAGDFVVIDHDLPTAAQAEKIIREIAVEENDLPADITPIVSASSAMTRKAIEEAVSVSLARYNRVDRACLMEAKKESLLKAGLTLYTGNDTFKTVGGLDNLKNFCLRAMGSNHPIAKPRGVLCLGVPGTGKSAFAKALANETGRTCLILDIGGLKGGIQGSTEQALRRALARIDREGSEGGKVVLFLDEIDKALAGMGTTASDGGVMAAVGGTLLTWLNDHTSDVFTIATANDASNISAASSGAFTRAGRFDGIFFFDFPTATEKAAIWKIYRDFFKIDTKDVQPPDENWTGAEIRSCCGMAALLDCSLIQAALTVVPVNITSADVVNRLRTWANGRCLSASTKGRYTISGETDSTASDFAPKAARRVARPGNN